MAADSSLQGCENVVNNSTSVRTPKPVPPLREVAVVLVGPGRAGDVEVGPRHVAARTP